MGATALDSPRLFFSEQELIDMQNNSATQGILVIPEKAKRIAKKFDNLNAIDVINRQRAALNMEPLTSDSLKAFDGLPTESKFLLNYSATSMTSARAWGKYGENLEVLAPKGVLDTLDNGLDFGHKMATYETGLLLDDLGVKFDSTDELYKILNPEQKDEYNKFLYKYSGGTDKYALKNLIIEGLEKDVENRTKKK